MYDTHPWLRYHQRKWKCECCGFTHGVELHSSRTMYHQNAHVVANSFQDANRDIGLCRSCAIMHREYWDEMWSNVYGNY